MFRDEYVMPDNTELGEVITFATKAEFDAFCRGIEYGVRVGNEQGWDDGYRAGDLVDMKYDREAFTVTEVLALGDEDGDED